MESLDLTYKLFNLKVKSKAPDQIYFMSQVFQEHSLFASLRIELGKFKSKLFENRYLTKTVKKILIIFNTYVHHLRNLAFRMIAVI